jgi:outer membrane protein OmpA-like peptidoglycan-associated protein
LFAQTETPSAEQMIEQLKTPPRTRGLRNLTVEAAAAPVNRPALSLLIQFDFDSARVRTESQQALANLSQALQSTALMHSRFVIEGHTDAKGSAEYNQRLSQQRAEAVRDYLKAQGVDAARLVASGKGSSEPAEPAQPLSAANRRVRIVNLE